MPRRQSRPATPRHPPAAIRGIPRSRQMLPCRRPAIPAPAACALHPIHRRELDQSAEPLFPGHSSGDWKRQKRGRTGSVQRTSWGHFRVIDKASTDARHTASEERCARVFVEQIGAAHGGGWTARAPRSAAPGLPDSGHPSWLHFFAALRRHACAGVSCQPSRRSEHVRQHRRRRTSPRGS